MTSKRAPFTTGCIVGDKRYPHTAVRYYNKTVTFYQELKVANAFGGS